MFLLLLLLFGLLPSTAMAAASEKSEAKPAKPPKVHSVALGPMKRVPYVASDVAAEDKSDEASNLRVRALFVDTRQKEWTTGEIHEVTDRTFTVQRVLHVNDTLPGEHGARWVWQPGPWMLVDRVTGRVSALRLPEFDAGVSDVSWYRDYAAYCGIHTAAKNGGVSAVVWQIGSRRPALERVIGKWPQTERVRPVCAPAKWQREPMRVTMQQTGAAAASFDIVGTATALVEEGDGDDE